MAESRGIWTTMGDAQWLNGRCFRNRPTAELAAPAVRLDVQGVTPPLGPLTHCTAQAADARRFATTDDAILPAQGLQEAI